MYAYEFSTVKVKSLLSQLLTFYIGCLSFVSAQTIIGSYPLQDQSFLQEIYPYTWIEYAGDSYGICTQPALRLSQSEFIYLRKPQTDNQKRIITCFDLLAKPQWENHLRLAKGEEIFSLYRSHENLIALCYSQKKRPWQYSIYARCYDLKDGSPLPRKPIYGLESKQPAYIGWDLSPDSSFLVVYHYELNNGKKGRPTHDFPAGFDKIGHKISHVSKLHFKVFGKDLNEIDGGEILLTSLLSPKAQVLDCQLDNRANLCITSFQKDSGLTLIRRKAGEDVLSTLTYQQFPDPFADPPYQAHLLPVCQPSGRVLAAHALRQRKEIQRLRVVSFDFDTHSVDTSRVAKISSSFRVKVAKERQSASLKPSIKFDGHMIKELFELEDGTVWLLTQRYTVGAHPHRFDLDHVVNQDDQNSTLEEIILYEFTPDKQAKKAIILPMLQQANSPLERVSRFYSMEVNPQTHEMHLITREYDGDRMTEPPRIFYRHISLDLGLYSDRRMIYNGKQKNQFYIRAYTLFLNPKVAVMMVVNGDKEAYPEVVSVKLN